MKNIRPIYDRMPVQLRRGLRSMLPRQLLRWYAHRNTDIYLVSYPKCGRTWLRLMMGKAITDYFSLPDSEDALFLRGRRWQRPGIPRITVIHDDRPMLKAPDELETSKAYYRDKKVIFLVRDPRDVIVSSYFEATRRSRIFGENPYETRKPDFEGSLPEFIERQEGGFDTILQYYNIWAANAEVPQAFLLVRYEDLKANPTVELRRVLTFIGLEDVSEAIVSEAIAFAAFENMRKMEARGQYQSGILNPADPKDQDSYKTRKGKVGGYTEYLDSAEIQRLDEKIQTKLSKIFNYKAKIIIPT